MAGDGYPSLQKESSLDAKQLEEVLHNGIMSRVDDVLAQQEHALWSRGQEEIAQLHEERQQADLILKDLQIRQDALVKDQQDMQCALSVITDQLEQVSMEFFEAVRRAGVPQVPAGQPDKAFDALVSDFQSSLQPLAPLPDPAAGFDASLLPYSFDVAAQAAAMAAAAAAAVGLSPESAAIAAASAALESSPTSGGHPRTPPRLRAGTGQVLGQLPSLPQVGTPGPAPAILSLASALPTDTPPRPAPPGPSRLSLAACLEAEAASKPPTPLAAQLRAEAPAFVPGGNGEAR